MDGVTDLQLRLSGPCVLGRGCSHCDGSNQLGVFPLQPLGEAPQEPGETFRTPFRVLGRVCLQEYTRASEGRTAYRPCVPGIPSEAE